MGSDSSRLIGLDMARALAIFGMMIVHFVGGSGYKTLEYISYYVSGNSSSTFVFLAGVGMALMMKSAWESNDADRIKAVRVRIWKRSVFLMALGLLFYLIWPADILHSYALFMSFTALFLTTSNRTTLYTTISRAGTFC